VIAARLSKGHSDLYVISPNQYALLESGLFSTGCNTNVSQMLSNKKLLFPKDQIDEREYKDQKERPRMSNNSSELPNAGEESCIRTLPSVQGSIRSLNCETAQHTEQGNQPVSNQKNQNQRPRGSKKEPEKNTEVRHNFQRRNCGQRAPPGTAKWVAQRLAEEKPEQRIGILRLWVNPKRQAEATEETIEEINNLSDEDAEEALIEMRRPKQYIRKLGSLQMNIPILLQTLEDG